MLGFLVGCSCGFLLRLLFIEQYISLTLLFSEIQQIRLSFNDCCIHAGHKALVLCSFNLLIIFNY